MLSSVVAAQGSVYIVHILSLLLCGKELLHTVTTCVKARIPVILAMSSMVYNKDRQTNGEVA